MSFPLPSARIKVAPEDFVVEEIPAYAPSGVGEHLYLRFTKRNLTTDSAVRAIASALKVSGRDVGVAGMKDKIAVTTQTISLPVPRGDAEFDARAAALSLPGITVHEARRHGNKLKTGHLAGNRFEIKVRGIAPDELDSARARLGQMAREGLPNAYGAQRFGRAGDNADRAREWLTGKGAGPRDPRMKRLWWSALQSAAFNAVLDARVADGTWTRPLLGDLLKKRDSGGLFLCTDVQADGERAHAGEVSPTGPMIGVKMRSPEGQPAELERAVVAKILGDGFDLAVTKALGEGTRRALRLWVEDLRVEASDGPDSSRPEAEKAESARGLGPEQGSSIRVYFVLPKGAYATTVLGGVFRLEEGPESTVSASDEPDPESN